MQGAFCHTRAGTDCRKRGARLLCKGFRSDIVRRAHVLLVLLGGHAHLFFENVVEIRLRIESALGGDGDDGKVGGEQHFFCLRKSFVDQIFMRRYAHDLAEQFVEIDGAEIHKVCNVFQLDVVHVIFRNVFFRFHNGFEVGVQVKVSLFSEHVLIGGNVVYQVVDVADQPQGRVLVCRGGIGVFDQGEKLVLIAHLVVDDNFGGGGVQNIFQFAFGQVEIEEVAGKRRFRTAHLPRFEDEKGVLFHRVLLAVDIRVSARGKVQLYFVALDLSQRRDLIVAVIELAQTRVEVSHIDEIERGVKLHCFSSKDNISEIQSIKTQKIALR